MRKRKKVQETAAFQRIKESRDFWRERCYELEEKDRFNLHKFSVNNPIYELGWRDGNRARRLNHE